MKAIICAAGESKRMSAITRLVPKPLLPLGNKTIIEHLLYAIAIGPVDEIIIIVGYLANEVKNRIGKSFNGIPVKYITNDSYSATNNMYSIYLARKIIHEDVVFASGDVYIKPEAGHDFILKSQKDSIFVDNSQEHFDSDDPVKVAINKNSIISIDKNLPKDNINGIAIGVYKLSSELIRE